MYDNAVSSFFFFFSSFDKAIAKGRMHPSTKDTILPLKYYDKVITIDKMTIVTASLCRRYDNAVSSYDKVITKDRMDPSAKDTIMRLKQYDKVITIDKRIIATAFLCQRYDNAFEVVT